MQIEANGRIRNQVFMAFVVAALLLLLIAWLMAEKQNESFLRDAHQYQQVEQLMKASRYAEAAPILAELWSRHGYSYQIAWRYALCLMAEGKWKEAYPYIEQARQIRPALVTEPTFLLQSGEIFYRNDEKARAKSYFQQTLKYGESNETGKMAAQFLQQMENEN